MGLWNINKVSTTTTVWAVIESSPPPTPREIIIPFKTETTNWQNVSFQIVLIPGKMDLKFTEHNATQM